MKRYKPPTIPCHCKECGTPFLARTRKAEFHDGNCRSKWNRRHKKLTDRSSGKANKRSQNGKTPETLPYKLVTCACCDVTFLAPQHSQQIYLNPAHKQRAYRARCRAGVFYDGRPRRGVAPFDLPAPEGLRQLYELAIAA